MKTEEITAEDTMELERLVALKEAEGWKRDGEPVLVHSELDENGVDYISHSQMMTKDEE